MRHPWKSDLQRDLSWFLVVYLLALLGILLAVHVLQPAWEVRGSASRSPIHQDRLKTAKQAIVTQAATVR